MFKVTLQTLESTLQKKNSFAKKIKAIFWNIILEKRPLVKLIVANRFLDILVVKNVLWIA